MVKRIKDAAITNVKGRKDVTDPKHGKPMKWNLWLTLSSEKKNGEWVDSLTNSSEYNSLVLLEGINVDALMNVHHEDKQMQMGLKYLDLLCNCGMEREQ